MGEGADRSSSQREPTAATLIAESLGRNVGRLIEFDPVARAGDDPEGVHQMRVATRRLRAELRLFSPAMKTKAVKRLRTELRWLGQTLGAARDIDVLRTHLVVPGDLAGSPTVAGVVSSHLAAERSMASAAVTSTLDSPRYRTMVRAIVAAVIDPPLRPIAAVPARGVLLPGLRKSSETLLDAVDDLGESATALQLHRVRIFSKRLRYGADAAVAFDGTRARAVAGALADVQDALGEIRDAEAALVVLHGLIDRSPGLRSDEDVADVLHAMDEAKASEVERHAHAFSSAIQQVRTSLSEVGWTAER